MFSAFTGVHATRRVGTGLMPIKVYGLTTSLTTQWLPVVPISAYSITTSLTTTVVTQVPQQTYGLTTTLSTLSVPVIPFDVKSLIFTSGHGKINSFLVDLSAAKNSASTINEAAFMVDLSAAKNSASTMAVVLLPNLQPNILSIPVNPPDENVVLLMHMDGANGGTLFPDSSTVARTISEINPPTNVTTTTALKFGTAGASFIDSSGLYITDATDLQMGSSDFTIEFWFNGSITLNPTYWNLVLAKWQQGGSIASYAIGVNGSTREFYFGVNSGATYYLTTGGSTTIYNDDNWHFIAAVKNGTSLKLYVDGIQSGSGIGPTSIDATPGVPLTIGAYSNDGLTWRYASVFKLDELRITKGIAVYTANFAVPTTAFPTPLAIPINPPDENVVLLLHGDGANGSTAIVDSSLNQKSLSVLGNSQLSTTQSKFGGSSMYFDGAGDYLSIPGTSFVFGTSAFTIEAWIYQASFSNLIIGNTTAGSDASWQLMVNPSGKLMFLTFITILVTSATSVPQNQWVHVSVSFDGSTYKLFINGILDGVGIVTRNLNVANPLYVGTNGASSSYYLGYIDELRITKGIAVYTSSFAVPTTAFPTPLAIPINPPDANIVLLLYANGVDGSTNIIDSSFKNKMINVMGATKISTSQSKFGGSSIYFNNAGTYDAANYLYSTSEISDFAFPGDFTIEFFLYPLSITGSVWGVLLIDTRATSLAINSGWVIYYGYGPENHKLVFYDNNSNALFSNTAPIANVWTHIAIVRNGSIIKMYVDGIAQTATLTNASSIEASKFNIGRAANNTNNTGIPGYLEEVRITKGTAIYTRDFIVPTTPFTVVPTLWLKGEGENDSTLIVDSSQKHTITAMNTAKVSTAQSRIGGSSIYFDGNGYLLIPASSDFNFGAGDFTIECWVYKTANNGTTSRLWCADGDIYCGINPNIDAAGNLAVYFSTSGVSWTHYNATVANLNNNQWYHIAIVRSGGIAWAYVNGVQYVVTASLGNVPIYNYTGNYVIGGQTGSYRTLYGYIDDFKITKGVAVYTSPFTV